MMQKEINLIQNEVEKVISGKTEVIRKILMAILAEGHILLDDVPGVGKTTMAVALGKTMNLVYNRVQFTPDVLPSDIVGFSMYNKETGAFEYKPGIVTETNLLLGDEINRTSSKTQSALLEAMEENQVTVDGHTYPLPKPFVVLATQNPLESFGTFPLPDAQMDRFFMRLSLGYMTREQELSVISRPSTSKIVEELEQVTRYFASELTAAADGVPRDASGVCAADRKTILAAAGDAYDGVYDEFPFLRVETGGVKPFACSNALSVLRFTGFYFPFTGEANVNMDSPVAWLPSTVCHEMAHQRMVASELEANFVGIAAAVSCGDPVFQYSGWLMGLIQLCNALYAVSPDLWYQIAAASFTPELSTDWEDNNAYWRALESPVEEAAAQTFDTFLKSNGQDLGIQSYGACVDLLVTYFGPAAGVN